MVKQSLPAVSEIDENSLQELKALDTPLLVAYVEAEDTESLKVFTSVAESLRNDYIFGRISTLTLSERETTDLPFIVLHNPLDELELRLQDKFGEEAITRFATTASKPVIGRFGLDTLAAYTEEGIPLALIFAETEEERKTLSKAIEHIATKFRDTMNFATVDAKKFHFFAAPLGLETGRFPAFVIHDVEVDEMFPLDQDVAITADVVEELVQNVLSGKRNMENAGAPEITKGAQKARVHDEI